MTMLYFTTSMSSVSFMFLQLLAVATTSCQASTVLADADLAPVKSAGFFFAEPVLDEAMWDALTEAALALAVFGVASACMKAFRKRKSKIPRAQKGKATSCYIPSPPAATNGDLRSASAKPSPASANIKAAAPWKRPAPGLAAPAARAAAKFSEADAIAAAVGAGKGSQLPQLLDAALARSLAAAAGQASEEAIATSLLQSALRACAAARRFHEAIAAYDHMAARIGGGNTGIWSVLLYSVVETRAFGRCTPIFEHLCEQAISGHDFVNMVRCYVGRQDAAGLREMLAKLCRLGQSIDAYTWNRALAACSNSECALELAEELAVAGICPEGIDAVGYNTLMKYNASAGRLSRCFELRAEMLAKGLQASEVTFGILLEACVGAREIDQARKVFGELCSSGLKLNVVHCTTFIKALVGARRLDEAAGVLEEMARSSGVKPDLITYSTIVKAYADDGDVASALKMLEQMLQESVRPDEIVFNSVLTGCCTFPMKSARVMCTFETLVSLGMRPTTTTLSILLKGLAHSEAWSTSLQILKDAPKDFRLEPETRLYAQLAQACVKARNGSIVVEVFHCMLEATGRRHEKVSSEVVGRFLRSCVLGGETDVAVTISEVARRAGIAIDAQADKMVKSALAKKKARLQPRC